MTRDKRPRIVPLNPDYAGMAQVSPYWWPILAVVRTLLSLSFVAVGSASFPAIPLYIVVLASGYTVYSLLALLAPWVNEKLPPALSFSIDIFFFLIFAGWTGELNLWFNSLFYVYLHLAAALLHGWREAFGVLVVCQGFLLVVPSAQSASLQPIVLLGGIMACALALDKRNLLDRLQLARTRIALLEEETVELREKERQQIANDFHDGPLQAFIGLQMRLNFLQQILKKKPEAAEEEVRDLAFTTRNQVTALRQFVREMRPPEIEGEDPGVALRRMIEAFRKDTGIQASFASADLKGEPEVFLQIMQLVREALNNIQKHSRASRVSIALEHKGDQFEVSIEEDGQGFPFCGLFSLNELDALRIGPVSIRQRLRAANGQLLLESRPGAGTLMIMRLPANMPS
jgi:signal transduction histidine kinase